MRRGGIPGKPGFLRSKKCAQMKFCRSLIFLLILCFGYRRSASRGCATSFERRVFQILKDSRPLPHPGAKAATGVRLGSSLGICYRDKKRSVKEI
jgi:hypothetical protein